MSRATRAPSAAERLAELDSLPGGAPAADVLGVALRAGQRRRRRRTGAVAVLACAAVVGGALVRHATTDGTATSGALPLTSVVSTVSGPLPPDAQRAQDAVQDALAAVAPGLPAVDWASARTSTARAARPAGLGAEDDVLVDVTRSAAFAGGGPGGPGGVGGATGKGGPRPGVAYRITTPLLRSSPADPCRVRGALEAPAATTGAGAPRCTLHTGLPGGPGGSAAVPGAGGVVALWEWQREGSAVDGAVQTVHQAVLVSGGTTWSLAATAAGAAGSGAEPALDLDQLELGVRYLATAATADGPGVPTARLVSQAVLARGLASLAPGAPAVDWASAVADSAGTSRAGPDGRPLLDVLESTGLGSGARLGYRVVRAAGPAPQDPCAAAGVVARQRGATCRSEQRDGGTRVAVLDRPGARQVTVVVTPAAAAGVGRWVAVAVTAPGPSPAAAQGPALPLDAGQLELLARDLAATDGP